MKLMSPALVRAMMELPPITKSADWGLGPSYSRIVQRGSNGLVGHGCTFMVIDDVKDSDVFPKVTKAHMDLDKEYVKRASERVSRAVERAIVNHIKHGVQITGA